MKQIRLEALRLAITHSKEWAETLLIATYYEEYLETGEYKKETKNASKKQR